MRSEQRLPISMIGKDSCYPPQMEMGIPQRSLTMETAMWYLLPMEKADRYDMLTIWLIGWRKRWLEIWIMKIGIRIPMMQWAIWLLPQTGTATRRLTPMICCPTRRQGQMLWERRKAIVMTWITVWKRSPDQMEIRSSMIIINWMHFFRRITRKKQTDRYCILMMKKANAFPCLIWPELPPISMMRMDGSRAYSRETEALSYITMTATEILRSWSIRTEAKYSMNMMHWTVW